MGSNIKNDRNRTLHGFARHSRTIPRICNMHGGLSSSPNKNIAEVLIPSSISGRVLCATTTTGNFTPNPDLFAFMKVSGRQPSFNLEEKPMCSKTPKRKKDR